MIREELRRASTEALRDGNKTLRIQLSTVLARFDRRESDADFPGWTEDEERRVIAKYVEELRGAIALMPPSMRDTHPYQEEIARLSSLLPQAWTEEQVRDLASQVLANGPMPIGEFMRRMLKDSSAGKQGLLDGGLVRKVAQDLGVR